MNEKVQEKKKRVVFTVEEIDILIQLWTDSGIQKKFSTSVRHNVIWEQLASQMQQLGFNRTASEIKSKINNLKTEYRKCKPTSGSATPDWLYYKAMHSVLGQRDVQRDELVEDSLTPNENLSQELFENNFSEMVELPLRDPTPNRPRLSELERPGPCKIQAGKAVTVRHPTPDRPRLSELERPGPSKIQAVKAPEEPTARPVQDVHTAEYSEEEMSEAAGEIEEVDPSPKSKTKEKSFQRIPRPSQRKVKELDQIINFFKSAEERQAQQLEQQNQILQNLLKQDLEAKQRDDRVADAFIKSLNILTSHIMKQDKITESSTYRHSPPLRISSPASFRQSSIAPSTFIPAQNSSGQHPPPRFVVLSPAPPDVNRFPSTILSTSQSSPNNSENKDEKKKCLNK